MIYLLAAAMVMSAYGFFRRTRDDGFRSVLLDTIAAAGCGWIAGILIGIGARIGMWAIPAFNGTSWEFTLAGSLQVVLVFSLYGIGLGAIYEILFRRILMNRGLAYGLLITIAAVYPLGVAASQQLSFEPGIFAMTLISFFFVGLMFIPFALALEVLLHHYHRLRSASADYLMAARNN